MPTLLRSIAPAAATPAAKSRINPRRPVDWPTSHVRATRKRSSSSITCPIAIQRSATPAEPSASSRDCVHPSAVRTSPATSGGRSSRRCAAHSSRCSLPSRSTVRVSHPGPDAIVIGMRRTNDARPEACASTRRAAARSQSAGGSLCAEASPRRTRSSSHTRHTATPSRTRASRCAARLACDSRSTGLSGLSAGSRRRPGLLRRPFNAIRQPGGDPVRFVAGREDAGVFREEQQQPEAMLAGELAARTTALECGLGEIHARLVRLLARTLTESPDRTVAPPENGPLSLAGQRLARGRGRRIRRERSHALQ